MSFYVLCNLNEHLTENGSSASLKYPIIRCRARVINKSVGSERIDGQLTGSRISELIWDWHDESERLFQDHVLRPRTYTKFGKQVWSTRFDT